MIEGNMFFKEKDSSLVFSLYQDSIKAVSLLESWRKGNKILAAYMTLAHILPQDGSSADLLLLVLLSWEQSFKCFGQDSFNWLSCEIHKISRA